MSYQYTATSAVLDISTLCLCVCHYVRYVDTHSHVEGNEAATLTEKATGPCQVMLTCKVVIAMGVVKKAWCIDSHSTRASP